ncbi:unnamed protein product [Ectocarpus fasciculatus]
MFLRAIRAAEPALKELSRRVFSPWKGNHVACGDLSSTIIPWGFVSQEKVSESVRPDRAGDGPGDDSRVEKRAEHLNLDTWEFLRGAELAYRCAAGLFAPPPHKRKHPLPFEEATAAAPAFGQAGTCRPRFEGELVAGSRRECDGRGSAAGAAAGAGEGEVSVNVGPDLPPQRAEGGRATPTDFFDFDVASPEMSMFLNDVLESYRIQGLVPRLSVASVEAKLCKVGVRLGGISKNTNFGMMSADEARYHLTMGMLGPEGVVINELEGRAPQRVIADVELTCEEEFVVEDGAGNVVHKLESQGPKARKGNVHYITLQSNIGRDTELEWQITNINDVIKPTFNYYFSRFGH